MEKYNQLQLREIFHLEFLRWLGRKMNTSNYALKGGVNLRFFYGSIRYSEDMDFDVRVVSTDTLQKNVMQILDSASFHNTLKPFGIEKIISPDMSKAKQTETTQRFKVHLITSREEDLFTKVEFSRRGFSSNNVKAEPMPNIILREYKLAPLIVPHYNISSAVCQKVSAMANRSVVQARDAFDIYLLSSQIKLEDKGKIKIGTKTAQRARENILDIKFEEFRDKVVFYLSKEDRKVYDSSKTWDDIKLRAIEFIEEL